MSRLLYQQRMLTRRAFVLGGVQALGATALLSRLYYLQFVKGDEYLTEAEGNRIKVQLLMPPRGIITDRQGVVLAGNDINYRLMLDRERPDEARRTLKRIYRLLKWPKAEWQKLDAQIPQQRPAPPILIREHLLWQEMAAIEFHLPELAGVSIEEGQWRNYPFSDHAAHLLGYVGRVAQNEVKPDEPLLSLPEMKIGKNGVEVMFEKELQGKAGARHVEVNVRGMPVRILKTQEPVAGDTLKLTVDAALQEFIIEKLVGQSGAVVVMHVHTGEILALVSVPGFDPNEFSKGIHQNYWDSLLKDEKNPLLNKAIAGQYPPGSTFKMITGLAGLAAGKVNAQTRIFCPGFFMLGNHRANCWKPEGHGHVNLQEAIAGSCDTYFYTVGRAVGIQGIADMAREFGLGASTGLGLKGERAGIIPDPAWKMAARNASWNPGETINTAIGQGDVLTTPLQLAVMTARMVNGGKKIHPRLLPATEEDLKKYSFIDIEEAHLREVIGGMDMVVNSPVGTAYATAIKEEAYKFAGKTGTSQVRRITVRGQNQNLIPWRFRHHALFVGYAPSWNPTYACAVMIEHGGGGASTAAPIARDVMRKTLEVTGA